MGLSTLFWGFVIVAAQLAVLVWVQRRRRAPAILDAPAASRDAVSAAIKWSMYGGMLWGASLLFVPLAVARAWPTWLPPQAGFVPVMLGQICMSLATRPPGRR